jgi:hypothetical protein
MMRAEVTATSFADDLSYRSLRDAMSVTDPVQCRVIGGHMVSLLLAVFPVAGVPIRRTRDADVAIPTELAATGSIEAALRDHGYQLIAGNSFSRPMGEAGDDALSIDILVPSADSRFRRVQIEGRGFDAAPGLMLALAAPALQIDVEATLLDGTRLTFSAPVPSVELAVVLKALSFAQRREPRDREDLWALLEVRNAYAETEVGGWQLIRDGIAGARGDAILALNVLSAELTRERGQDSARLAALIAEYVTHGTPDAQVRPPLLSP